jgi:uncharacterized membrane protein
MISPARARNVPTKVLAGPDRFDRVLGTGALILLAMAIAAVARGSADWAKIPWQVWIHLATIALALALTPVILWQRRGDHRHRLFGYIWVAAMAITAALTFDIRLINRGGFSPIHLLSALTLIALVRVVLTARARNRHKHRQAVRMLALGALLIAGFFTFPFDRLLGHWLFS